MRKVAPLSWVIFLSLFQFSLSQNVTDKSTKERSFSIFHVVNFKNGPCRSQMTFTTGTSAARNGTCYTQSECSSKGGTVSGNCASGFGVCCVFIYTTTNSINQNNSYLQNPGFPSGYTGTTGLTYTINKCASNVCWIRLDFETMSINGPADSIETNGGACNTDSLKITTSTTQVIPTICGSNAGQHIYIDVGNLPNDSAMVQFTIQGTAVGTRTWDIRESQIECSNPNRPPNGCLQYLTTLTGRITTFNFIPTGSNHLATQEYSTCIRAQAGYCCIQYQVCPDTVITNYNTGFSLDMTATKSMQDNNCNNDYVGIPGSSAVCGQSNTLSNKYCGSYLNQQTNLMANIPICDCSMPFFVHIHTEGTGTGTETIAGTSINRGICLDYMQIPCTN